MWSLINVSNKGRLTYKEGDLGSAYIQRRLLVEEDAWSMR